jgi:hypothetical protein
VVWKLFLVGNSSLKIKACGNSRTFLQDANCKFFVNNSIAITYQRATMDLNSLKEAAANLSLYDIKAGVRKVQNGKVFLSASWPQA